MSTDTIERPGTIDVVETTPSPQLAEPGDHERLTHVVRATDLDVAFLSGQPIEAVCGKFWLPTRDPNAFPICGTCKEWIEATQRPEDDAPFPEHPGLSYE